MTIRKKTKLALVKADEARGVEEMHNDADKKISMRKAMSTFDLILTIGIVGVVLGGIIWMWTGAKGKLETKKFADKAMVVISGIEKAKSDYNSDAYVANGSAAIPTIQKLNIAMGGAKATYSLNGWTYQCPAGDTSTITVTTESKTSTDVLNGAALTINDKYTDWTATVNGNSLTITRPNSVCK